jgi:hypothetical protein
MTEADTWPTSRLQNTDLPSEVGDEGFDSANPMW